MLLILLIIIITTTTHRLTSLISGYSHPCFLIIWIKFYFLFLNIKPKHGEFHSLFISLIRSNYCECSNIKFCLKFRFLPVFFFPRVPSFSPRVPSSLSLSLLSQLHAAEQELFLSPLAVCKHKHHINFKNKIQKQNLEWNHILFLQALTIFFVCHFR